MIDRINAWAAGVIGHSAGIIDWTIKYIKRMDIRTRKIMTMNGALHPRLSVGSLCLKRCESGRGLLSMEECILAETKSLSGYIRTKEKPMLKEVRRENFLSDEETNEEYQKRMHKDRSKGRVSLTNLGKIPNQ